MSNVHVTRLGRGPRVVLVHGSLSNGLDTFARQQPLADRFALEIVDRRGFGQSPARPTGVDFDRDADDVLELLADGRTPAADGDSDGQLAHLVGHSYGGIVAMVAAAREPTAVRSLTVVEPPAMGIGRGVPAVDLVDARTRSLFSGSADTDPAAWMASFLRALGYSVPDPPVLSEGERSDVRSSMTERFPGEADPNLEAIRDAGVPSLVVRGDWSKPAGTAAEIGGAAFAAICDIVARRLDARLVVIPGASHNPQLQNPTLFNEVLASFLSSVPSLEPS